VLPPYELGAVAQLHRLGRDHEHDIAGLEIAGWLKARDSRGFMRLRD
jgi:hypothetical protein